MQPRKLSDINFKMFVDFDGTISKYDIGEILVKEYGDTQRSQDIIDRWVKGEIDSALSWKLMCDSVGELDVEKFLEHVNSLPIDPGFHDFVDYCDKINADIAILSDGMNLYINSFLKKEKLDYLTVYSNKVVVTNENRLIPSFPYGDEECKQCGNCKRNHILENSHDDDFTVYVGDGNSDLCPAQYCDFVFAKGSLLKYCEKNRISYFPFNTFHDVIDRLSDLGNKKRLKKRHQAELKRREVYMRG